MLMREATNAAERSTSGNAPMSGSNALPAMRLKGLSKTYPGNKTPAVDNLSLDVYDGEIVTLLQ